MSLSTRTDFLNTGLVPVSTSDACPICLNDPMVDPVKVTSCSHVFCRTCITEWLNQPTTDCCALCRKQLFDASAEAPKPGVTGDLTFQERHDFAIQALHATGLIDFVRPIEETQGLVDVSALDMYNETIPWTPRNLAAAVQPAARFLVWDLDDLEGLIRVRSSTLSASLVAMANMIPGFRVPQGLAFTDQQSRAWRRLVIAVWRQLQRFDGRSEDGEQMITLILLALKMEFEDMGGAFAAFFSRDQLALDLTALVSFVVQQASREEAASP